MEKRSNGAEKMDVVLTNDNFDMNKLNYFAIIYLELTLESLMRQVVGGGDTKASGIIPQWKEVRRNEALAVTLWVDRARQFLDVFTPSNDGPLFVVMTGLLAKKFSDAASFSSTDATRSYVNIDYPPLNALKICLTTATTGKNEPLSTPIVEQFVTSNGDRVQELTISSILETVIPDSTQAVRCTCRAKIVGILDENGWYYNCCPTCANALPALDGAFLCLACDEEIPSLAQRFRIVVQIEDKSGSTTVTLFNKDAEQLIGVPLHILLTKIISGLKGNVQIRKAADSQEKKIETNIRRDMHEEGIL
ncbi:hypothetical protein AgCh_028086 [Apium graveolens]